MVELKTKAQSLILPQFPLTAHYWEGTLRTERAEVMVYPKRFDAMNLFVLKACPARSGRHPDRQKDRH